MVNDSSLGAIDPVESTTKTNFAEQFTSSDIMNTSHFGVDIHELDHGAFRLPARGTTTGEVVVMPKLPSGSCEFTITEQPEALSHLEQDAIFLHFVCKDKLLARNSALRFPENRRPSRVLKNDTVEKHPDLLYSSIETQHLGSIAVIELNRPGAKNAISRQLLHELNVQIDRIYSEAEHHQVRALIISSTVDDVFCAGADLKERKCMTLDETQEFLAELRQTFTRLAKVPVPSIACVSGFALGGGLELALCCDFRIFSQNAVVGLPETRLAIVPGAGGTYRLQKLVGIERALDMILTGRRVEAVEAARLGLCSRLIMHDGSSKSSESARKATFAAGISLAQEIACGGPIAVRAALSAVREGTEEAANIAYDQVLLTQDRVTALQHFGDGTSPRFVGR